MSADNNVTTATSFGNRILDVDTDSHFNPINGIDTAQDLSLRAAMEYASKDPEFAKENFEQSLTCAEFFAEDLNHVVLSMDEVAVLNLYTQESPFYRILNARLRNRDRQLLKPFLPLFRLMLCALQKLPPLNLTVYRGVKVNLLSKYQQKGKGKREVWWSFGSTTDSIDVLQDEMFLGKSGDRTLFIISALTVRDISPFSAFSKEKEYLLLPGTVFTIDAVLDSSLTMVQLKESEKGLLPKIVQGGATPDAASADPKREDNTTAVGRYANQATQPTPEPVIESKAEPKPDSPVTVSPKPLPPVPEEKKIQPQSEKPHEPTPVSTPTTTPSTTTAPNDQSTANPTKANKPFNWTKYTPLNPKKEKDKSKGEAKANPPKPQETAQPNENPSQNPNLPPRPEKPTPQLTLGHSAPVNPQSQPHPQSQSQPNIQPQPQTQTQPQPQPQPNIPPQPQPQPHPNPQPNIQPQPMGQIPPGHSMPVNPGGYMNPQSQVRPPGMIAVAPGQPLPPGYTYYHPPGHPTGQHYPLTFPEPHLGFPKGVLPPHMSAPNPVHHAGHQSLSQIPQHGALAPPPPVHTGPVNEVKWGKAFKCKGCGATWELNKKKGANAASISRIEACPTPTCRMPIIWK